MSSRSCIRRSKKRRHDFGSSSRRHIPRSRFAARLMHWSIHGHRRSRESVADCRSVAGYPSGADCQWWTTGPWRTIPIARPARTGSPARARLGSRLCIHCPFFLAGAILLCVKRGFGNMSRPPGKIAVASNPRLRYNAPARWRFASTPRNHVRTEKIQK